ncbi:hypothetical protein ACTVZO_11110 [Streptomyces sp. IBSNAI002]|uniref:hypothetical protein n=1 Tax=Streptomyces sp. IBSNAI002 TaxID=3457500 RepID=UPI003FD43660
MGGERITAVRLGARIRARAEAAAVEAFTVGTCGHLDASFVSGLYPSAGVWCPDCGDEAARDLLLTYWCLMCEHPARAGLTQTEAGGALVLLRTCGCCLTSDSPTSPDPSPTEPTREDPPMPTAKTKTKTPKTTSTHSAIEQACQDLTTPELLADLIATGRRALAGEPGAPFIAAACAVLQQRCGRILQTRRLENDDAAHKLVARVVTEGGFLALSADVARHALIPTLLREMATRERDPHGGHTVRRHEEVLSDLDTRVFPGPGLPSGMAFAVLYEADTLVGRLLTALTAGEDVAPLVEEITAAAG